MNGSILFLVLYGILFFLPGWLAWKLLKIRVFPLLFSVAVSYCLLVATLLITEFVGVSVSWFMAAWLGELLMLAGAVLIRRRHDARSLTHPARCGVKIFFAGFITTGKRFSRCWNPMAVAACICAGITVYMIYAGPYTEMPADAWAHLGRIQDQIDRLQTGLLPDVINPKTFFLSQGFHWYWIAAFLCWASGLTLADAMAPLAWANTLVFSLALGSFAWTVAARERISLSAKAWLAGLTVLFTLAHLGVSVFAYFRYYVYAPTLLNYVVYLAVAAVVLRYLRGGVASRRPIVLLPIFGLTLLTIHTQEALFAFVMCWAMGLACVIVRWSSGGLRALVDRPGRRGIAVAGLCTLLYGIGFVWLHFARLPVSEFTDKLISLRALGAWADGLLVMNPAGDCFQTITLWGCFVYVLALIFWRPLARNPYIAGGMAIPLLIWFNPLTVDMFLRQESAITVLYRIGYIIPLGFVGAYGIVRSVAFIRRAEKKRWLIAFSVLTIATLIVLLCPVRLGSWDNHFSRVYTLKKTALANDFGWWRDVVTAVRSAGKKQLVTDPVTAYFLRPLTGLPCADRNFWFKGSSIPGHDLPIVLAQIVSGSGWLLVVNCRDGAPGETWRKSGHWPENILEVSRWYSPASMAFIRDHPDCFRLRWSGDRAAIYDINSDALQPYLPSNPVMTLARPVMLEGPGIYIEWTSVRKQDFAGYHVQFSEDGINWQDLNATREYQYPWIHHQGKQTDSVGKWTYCLPAKKTFYYRVRALYHSGTSSWSDVMSATVADYEARRHE